MMSAETKFGEEAKPAVDAAKDGPEVVTPAEARRRQRALTRQLRQIFDDVVREPVPDDFMKLLEKIDEQHDEAVKSDK